MKKENQPLIVTCQIKREINCFMNIKTYLMINLYHLRADRPVRITQELANN